MPSVVELLQRRVVGGVERCGLLPHGPLTGPPAEAASHFQAGKADGRQWCSEVDPPQAAGQPFAALAEGLPAGQHRTSAGPRDPR
jgi:hypothetical protein